MSHATLRTVTLKTVANTRQAAEHAVGAYRAGGHRLIGLLQQGVDQAAQRSGQRLAPGLRKAGGSLGGLAGQGVDAVSQGSQRVIDVSGDVLMGQVQRVADLADKVDNTLLANGIQTAARISLPGAQAALVLSEKLVQTTAKLPGAQPAPVGRNKAGSALRRARAAAKAQADDAVVAVQKAAKAAKASQAKATKTAKAQPLADTIATETQRRVRKAGKTVRAASAKVVAEAGTAADQVTRSARRAAGTTRRAAKRVVADIAG